MERYPDVQKILAAWTGKAMPGLQAASVAVCQLVGAGILTFDCEDVASFSWRALRKAPSEAVASDGASRGTRPHGMSDAHGN